MISGNTAKDSYSFAYTVSSPYSATNVTISNNAIYNTNQGAYVSTTPPIAIDLPDLTNGSIVNNVISACAASGIGVFSSSKNITVSGNSLLNVCNAAVSWIGGISIGGEAASGFPDNIIVSGNTVKNTLGGGTMRFGLFLNTNCTNLYIADNTFTGATTSKFGYFVTGLPSFGNSFALTNNSPLNATICIVDADPANGVVTNWRKQNTLTSYNVNGTIVVGAQGVAIPDAAGGTEITTINSILAALRTHGLIAT